MKDSNITQANKKKSIKIVDLLEKWGQWAVQNKYNLALYRQPGLPPTLIIDYNPLNPVNQPIEKLSKGFVFANYGGKAYFIKADQIEVLTNQNTSPSYLEELENRWEYYVTNSKQPTTTKQGYTNEVTSCIEKIKSTSLTKAVPSKVKLIDLPKGFNLAEAFINLCNKYPTAFVSIVSTHEFGTWLTATPELLIKVTEQGIFETMALAGTQKREKEKPLHDVAWVDKDIEEQAMVTRYIINRFKEIRLREFVEKGPMTVQAGNLTHLCTNFTVDTKATGFPNLGGVMLDLLHPTSAVCGMPKEPALELIQSIEKHDRKFYSGYLGPIKMEHQMALYVNLRCMQVYDLQANLYAGAGVTAFSNPEKEWEETELKFNTLLQVIN